MKLIQRHIKKFEQFILNPKDPNEEKAKDIKKKKPITDSKDDEEPQEDLEEDEDDNEIIEEVKQNLKKYK